jgi:hypothetical protein
MLHLSKIILHCLLLLCSLSVSAQECLTENLDISSIAGVIQLRNGTPLSKAKIQLRDTSAKQKILATVQSDEQGYFRFPKKAIGVLRDRC